MELVLDSISKAANDKYPRSHDKFISYGTAGFRTKAEDLSHVMYRMGILAVLRAKLKKATIGAMITASHNPEEDNGVKLVDPMGEMLEASWEKLATTLANVRDEQVKHAVEKIVQEENIDYFTAGNVFLAKDTRESSPYLSEALQCGIEAAGGSFHDYGLLTTPQLHYMVRCKNTKGEYGSPTEEGYYQKVSSAFCQLREQMDKQSVYKPTVYVDAANGVGAPKARQIQGYLSNHLNIVLCNDGSSGKLNLGCGADFVKVQQKAPSGITIQPCLRYASFDGDADRIVYYYADSDGKFHLMDGDKIATLIAGYLQDLLSHTGLSLNLAIVQTAYANGSSTKYISETLKVPVACVPTGVKHLHHKAQQYDIGVYFEANGHGTVLFSDNAVKEIQSAASNKDTADDQRHAAEKLSTVIDLINQTVGDAISDMLLVEVILSSLDWEVDTWDKAYTDLPNRQLKVKVADRTVIETADAERKAVTPEGLQDAVDQLVSQYNDGRSFVRPSGTEDVVRVYSEADTQTNADMLAYQVGLKVYEMAGGVGDKPQVPQH